jgi:hypothetical protein
MIMVFLSGIIADYSRDFVCLRKISNIELVQKKFSFEDKNAILDYPRYIIYKKVADGLKGSVLIYGVGLGDIKNNLNIHDQSIRSIDKDEYLNTHSQYLHYMMGTGVIGLILFLSFIIYLLYISIQNRDHLFLFFVVLVSINCIFENFLSRMWGVYFIAFFSSFFLSKYIDNSE